MIQKKKTGTAGNSAVSVFLHVYMYGMWDDCLIFTDGGRYISISG